MMQDIFPHNPPSRVTRKSTAMSDTASRVGQSVDLAGLRPCTASDDAFASKKAALRPKVLTHKRSFRTSDEMDLKLEQLAAELGISVGEVIRSTLEDRVPLAPAVIKNISQARRDWHAALRNLNQLAKKGHVQEIDREDFTRVMRDVQHACLVNATLMKIVGVRNSSGQRPRME